MLIVSQNNDECMDNVKTCRQKVISFALAIDWKANVDCYIRENHMDFIDFKCSLYFQWQTAKLQLRDNHDLSFTGLTTWVSFLNYLLKQWYYIDLSAL